MATCIGEIGEVMLNHSRRIGGLFAIIVAIILLSPQARWGLWGTLRRDTFYRGWPTGYWRETVRHCPITPYFRRTTLSSLRNTQRVTTTGWSKLFFSLDESPLPHELPLRDGDAGAIPVLMALLEDPDPRVRMYAAESLGSFGARARMAIGLLTKACQDQEVGGLGITVGEKASSALRQVQQAEAVSEEKRKR